VGHRVLTRAAAALVVVAAAAAAHADPTGSITGKVKVTDKAGQPAFGANAVVYVVGYTEPPDPHARAVIEQRGRAFVPDLVAITRGESVTFPNRDPVLHNVFSKSVARPFDLGSFKRGEAKAKDFPNLGVVDVYCNIHPEMAATILVLPNRRHTRVAADGSFRIDGVRPGHWTVFAYTRRAVRPVSTPVVVEPGKAAAIELSLVRGGEPEHLNQYGEPYRHGSATYR
jgi:plastocyanin